MKHIFYIHSHITYILSMSVLTSYQLPASDVMFIYGRQFRTLDIPPASVITLLPVQEDLGKLPSYGDRSIPFYYLRAIRPLDKTISFFVRDDCFTAYLPHTKCFLTQLLASHRRCIRLCIVEEGLLTYTGGYLKMPSTVQPSGWRGLLKRLTRYPFHLNRSSVWCPSLYKEPDAIFVLFPEMMPPGRYRLERPQRLYVPPVPDEFVCNGAVFLVLDPVKKGNSAEMTDFLHTWRSVLVRSSSSRLGGTVLVKFHPGQTPETCQMVVDILDAMGIQPKVVPAEVSAEGIFLRSRGLKVYGLHSSLLFYAAHWGHESFSLLKLLEDQKPGFRARYSAVNLPSVFWEAVKVLEQ